MTRYFSVGLTIAHHSSSSSNGEPTPWHVFAYYTDGGHCVATATEGSIGNRNGFADLAAAIDQVRSNVEALGIAWFRPSVFIEGNEEVPELAWQRRAANEQATRLGWMPVYSDPEAGGDS